MKLSRRAVSLAESATIRITRKAAELRTAGRSIVDLSAGQPDFPSPAVAVEEARTALAEGFTRYTASSGIPDLREALAERFHRAYGAPWYLPNTLITVGAKAALFQSFMALVDEGDHVVVPTPAWVSFSEQIRFAGGRPIAATLDRSEGFAIRADKILEAVDDRTRVVVINSPSNPSGAVVTAEDLRRIVEYCAERGIVLLSDETYERFIYDGQSHASAAALAAEFPDTVIVIGSFSKTYSMTGWRVGFALGPRYLLEKLAAIQSHATSNVTSFAMRGALAALEHGEGDVRRMISEFAVRRNLIVDGLQTLDGVGCPTPAGAFYVFPQIAPHYREGRHGSVEMAEFLLEKAGVAVVPGAAFGTDECIRLSFACPRHDLEQAIERISRALSI